MRGIGSTSRHRAAQSRVSAARAAGEHRQLRHQHHRSRVATQRQRQSAETGAEQGDSNTNSQAGTRQDQERQPSDVFTEETIESQKYHADEVKLSL